MNHDLHTGRPERRPVGTIAFPGGTDFAPEMTPAQVGSFIVTYAFKSFVSPFKWLYNLIIDFKLNFFTFLVKTDAT